jgi:hypothetical protein
VKNRIDPILQAQLIYVMAVFITGSILLFGSWALTSTFRWSFNLFESREWRMLVLALAAFALAGYLWVIVNMLGIFLAALIPTKRVRQLHTWANRYALVWLRRFCEWTIDTRQQGPDMNG